MVSNEMAFNLLCGGILPSSAQSYLNIMLLEAWVAFLFVDQVFGS
jgi:hypothetical protein